MNQTFFYPIFIFNQIFGAKNEFNRTLVSACPRYSKTVHMCVRNDACWMISSVEEGVSSGTSVHPSNFARPVYPSPTPRWDKQIR